MTYASGFMVGTSIGKAVYDLFHNKKKGGSAWGTASCWITCSTTAWKTPTRKGG